MMRFSHHCFGVLSALLLTGLVSAPQILAESPLPAFKIYLEEPGAYRVSFEDLAATDLPQQDLLSAGLGVTNAGSPVPVWVEDGGDGVFGPGDWIELLGEPLRGEGSYFSEASRYNVYVLRFDAIEPARMQAVDPAAAPQATPRHSYRTTRHMEEDLLILRLAPKRGSLEPDELWYWAKLVHNQKTPFAAPLELDGLAAGDDVVDLRIQFRGWSRPYEKTELADHSVEVSLNGALLASTTWNGTEPYLMEIQGVRAERFQGQDNVLTLAVPRRVPKRPAVTPKPRRAQPLIDVFMLNWIEVVYPHGGGVGERQTRFELVEDATASRMRVESLGGASTDGGELRLYGKNGSRTLLAGVTSLLPPAGERAFVVSRDAALLAPEAVVRDLPSRLRDEDQQADYILVAHRRLLEAALPLAELHRQRGLAVKVVDIEDIYDEFQHGVADPRALRSFLAHAYHHWQRPAPRFVLLVGDASWDGKSSLANDANYADWTYRRGERARFAKNTSTAYEKDADLNHRNLIPTWNHATYEGHSASDNYFVAVDGDDNLPDLAIGRLPVVEPGEVAQIVEKTRRYIQQPEPGPWRRNVLFVANDNARFQQRSDAVASAVSARGFSPLKVYPSAAESDNEHHTKRLREIFDEGQLVVHFFGHGGRYIWRTGPPDLKKNHDLFTLDDLDELQPTGRLPVVLSLTCYSAPFDHPSADSIGEKFLRLDGRGAVAVLAASWRNSPRPDWGTILLEELTTPGTTIGEAVQRSKHRIGREDFVQTYNLLGDPAAPVALPTTPLADPAPSAPPAPLESSAPPVKSRFPDRR